MGWLALLMLLLILIVVVWALWAILSKASVAESRSRSILVRNRELSRQIQLANHDLIQIFEAVDLPLFIVQKKTLAIKAMNKACVDLFGAGVAGSARRKLELLLRSETEPAFELVNLRRLLREGVSFPIDVEDKLLTTSATGAPLPVLVSVKPIQSNSDNEYIISLDDNAGRGDQEKLLREYYQLVDSTLTEQNLSEALRAVARLCKSVTGTEASIGLTIFDEKNESLKLVVNPEGLSEQSLKAIDGAKITFGNGAHATSALLKKEIMTDFGSAESIATEEMTKALKASGVHRWTAMPLLGMSGQVLGTLDFYLLNRDLDARIDFEKLATPLHLASATIERHHSIQALHENARFEGFLRFFNQQLMTTPHRADDSAFVDAINKIISFMQIPPSSLQCWMLDESENVYRPVGMSREELEAVGCAELSGENVRRWLESDELLIHKSEFEASLEAEYQCLHLSTDHKLARLMELSPDDAVREMGVTEQFIVFPLSADDTLEGFLVFKPREIKLDRKLNLLSTIAPILASALARHRLIESLMHKALHDRLTGLYNRNKIEEVLQHELDRSRRYENPLSVLLFDVDHFKVVNDNLGHDVGDRVLRELSELVSQKIRAADLIGRWGGEEFIVVLTETPIDKAIGVANTIRRDVEAHSFGIGESLTVSMGVAEYQPGDTKNALIKRADIALYQAKSGGRNNVMPSISRASRV